MEEEKTKGKQFPEREKMEMRERKLESELAAVVKGDAGGLGLQSCLADFGQHAINTSLHVNNIFSSVCEIILGEFLRTSRRQTVTRRD